METIRLRIYVFSWEKFNYHIFYETAALFNALIVAE